MRFDSESLHALVETLMRGDSPSSLSNELGALSRDDQELLALLAVVYQRESWCQALLDALPSAMSLTQLSGCLQLASLLVEDDEVEEFIDEALDQKQTAMLDALVRAQVVWTHPSFEANLNVPGAARDAAAILVAQHEPDVLEEWLSSDQPEQLDDILQVLRAAAFAEDGVSLDLLFLLREALEEEDEHKAVAQLDAVIAVVDLHMFARRVMLGEAETSWMRHPREVADVLSVYGATSWLETLAVLEAAQAMTAFEFAALLAIGASGALVVLDSQDVIDQTVDTLDAVQQKKKSWDAQALALELSIPMALGDDDLAPLLVEAALHERLFASGALSPGISGLPLSSNDVDALNLEGAMTLLLEVSGTDKPDDETVVRAVRTMIDAHRFLNDDTEQLQSFFTHTIWSTLIEHRHAAINLAARQVYFAHKEQTSTSHNPPKRNTRTFLSRLLVLDSSQDFDRQLLLDHVEGVGVVALMAAMVPGTLWQAARQPLELLGEMLLSCDVTRCDVVRESIETMMTRSPES